MPNLLFQTVFSLFFLSPILSNAQEMWQLISAQDFHKMKSGPEKIERIRALERTGWYNHDTYFDLKGKPMETGDIDLAPFVNEQGETVFLVTDIAPEFPGGHTSFEDYIQNTLGDLLAKPSESVQNSVPIKFSVEKDGSITEIVPGRVAEWIPADVIQRCKNALEEMPKWSPGIFKDRPVKVKMLMTFGLRE